MPLMREWSTLVADLDAAVEPDAALGERTWFRMGGRADLLVTPRSVEALSQLLARAHADGVPVRIFGGGANLLVLDEGVDGVVVQLSHECFKTLDVERGGTSARVRIGGGVDLFGLMHDLHRAGLSGLEHLAGIPGTVGGAVAMNAGGTFGDTAQALSHVVMVTDRGESVAFERSALDMGYRHGGLPSGVVTAAVFHMTLADPADVRARFQEYFNWKKARQPFGASAAGCMFRNPVDPATGQRVSAGKLIDQAGLKGFRVGTASVSPVHANFLSSEAGGNASDIAALSEAVAERVFAHAGIQLEREVVFWGRSGSGVA